MAKEIYLIIGLGNPGEKYAHTRHNAGFEVMVRLEAHYGAKLKKKLLLQGMTAEVADGEKKIVLCEPTTYMNRSGECVKRLKARFQVPDERMLVIYDATTISICRRERSGCGRTADRGRTTGCGASRSSWEKRTFPGSGSARETDRPDRTWRHGCWDTMSRKRRL